MTLEELRTKLKADKPRSTAISSDGLVVVKSVSGGQIFWIFSLHDEQVFCQIRVELAKKDVRVTQATGVSHVPMIAWQLLSPAGDGLEAAARGMLKCILVGVAPMVIEAKFDLGDKKVVTKYGLISTEGVK